MKESDAENRRTCSHDCRGKIQSSEFSGENNPNWKGGQVEIECEICGEQFSVWPAVADDRMTCSKDCYKELRSQKWSGEGNPNYKEPVWEDCVICGEEYRTRPYLSDVSKTCGSAECYRENMRRVNSGTTHPCWAGGYDEYYGSNWDEQRKKALERDDHTCQSCGIQDSETKQGLHVHHIKKKEWFVEHCGDEWWLQANEISNLVSLCDTCHQKWEGLPIRPILIDND